MTPRRRLSLETAQRDSSVRSGMLIETPANVDLPKLRHERHEAAPFWPRHAAPDGAVTHAFGVLLATAARVLSSVNALDQRSRSWLNIRG